MSPNSVNANISYLPPVLNATRQRRFGRIVLICVRKYTSSSDFNSCPFIIGFKKITKINKINSHGWIDCIHERGSATAVGPYDSRNVPKDPCLNTGATSCAILSWSHPGRGSHCIRDFPTVNCAGAVVVVVVIVPAVDTSLPVPTCMVQSSGCTVWSVQLRVKG